MSTKHTTGPWTIDAFNSGNVIAIRDGVSPSGKSYRDGRHQLLVARAWTSDSIDKPESHEEVEANARLIAAAPEMLAALEMVKTTCGGAENWNGETRAFILAADAAIAKAKGES